MIQLLLPGSAMIYYGDELGMEDTPLALSEIVDVRVKTLRKVRKRTILIFIMTPFVCWEVGFCR